MNVLFEKREKGEKEREGEEFDPRVLTPCASLLSLQRVRENVSEREKEREKEGERERENHLGRRKRFFFFLSFLFTFLFIKY